jgi:hypothetical protein
VSTTVEFAGIKFTGGKVFALITALSTLGGGAWAGFEFYDDYRDMKAQIQEYTAPDLSGIREDMSVLREEMNSVQDSVTQTADYTRDIKNDLRDDLVRMERIVDRVEDRVKDSEDDIREMIRIADERFDNKRSALETESDRKMKALEERMEQRVQRALNNPLAD